MTPIASDKTGSIRFNLLLQSEFPLNALILASEALRIANQNTGSRIFDWSFVTEDGNPVRASNGMWMSADCRISEMPAADVYLIFEGNLPTQLNSPKLLGVVRAAYRHGAIVGGVDTGMFALAQSGVLGPEGDAEIILHWEAVQSFSERYPEASFKYQLYSIKERVAQCAGGIATLDMVLDLVARYRGQALANEIANALVHTRREAESPQREDGLLGLVFDSRSRRLLEVMERNLEDPLPLGELAARIGISRRSLGRLCAKTFGQSPMRLYLSMRLQAARNLLFYDEFSIADVGLACGFSYPSVFSRTFHKQYGQSPRAFRARLRENQNLALRPELQRILSFRKPGLGQAGQEDPS